MNQYTHGFRIDQERCRGCLSCMRVCPTRAIRVRDGKARYKPDNCIDCGSCLKACSSGAITATTWSFEDIGKYKFRVAVPSLVLFGQFPTGITSDQIIEGLLSLGFDAVWDYGVDISLASRAMLDYVERWKGPFPLISVSCPVVVRLVQVSYPRMVNQLIQVELPRELAGREIKRKYSRELGISRDEIAAIYVTPCQAKVISILQPAEGVKSDLDGSVGISDVYNPILARAGGRKGQQGRPGVANPVRNGKVIQWYLSEGLGSSLSRHRYLHVTGLSNVMQVFDDIEKGKLRNVKFLEAYCCWSGCLGGNLTVANVYLTLSKFLNLLGELPEMDPETSAEVERRYPIEDLSLKAPIQPRPVSGLTGELRERVRMMQEAEAIFGTLPGLDCGLCGAPTCKELARDAVMGQAAKTDCVFYSKDRLRRLREIHLHRKA